MTIKIEDTLRDYLNKKQKKTLRLDIKITGGGCCDTFEMAEVETTPPENTGLYHEEHVDDITVYVSKRAKVLSTLVFKLQKTLFLNTIEVSGLSLITKS